MACTLFPFHFYLSNQSFWSVWNLGLIGIGTDGSPDILGNMLLFLPLGFTLTGYLERKRVRALTAMAAALFVSLFFSYVIEVLQLFLPGRFASLSDILSNSAGGGLGFLCYSLWRWENLPLAVQAYLISASLISIPLQWNTTLSSWDARFPLMLGNEHTGNRPWRGHLFDLSILERDISDGEVSDLYDREKPSAQIADSLVASYQSVGLWAYQDKSGHLPPLIRRTRTRAAGDENGVFPVTSQWLETAGPATYLTDRLKETSRFTLIATAATEDTRQDGPARIVSLSSDTSHRNFTLGQSRSDMVFRLRNLLNGQNGARSELIVPDVFSTHTRRHLVITYDGLDLLAYVDGARSSHAIRFGLGAAAFAPLFGRNPRAFYVYCILYYAVVFLPAGMLMSLAATTIRRQPLRILALAAGIVACSLSFEAILVAASGRIFSSANVLWSLMFAATAVVTCELTRSSEVSCFAREGRS
jgi:VanZ like family